MPSACVMGRARVAAAKASMSVLAIVPIMSRPTFMPEPESAEKGQGDAERRSDREERRRGRGPSSVELAKVKRMPRIERSPRAQEESEEEQRRRPVDAEHRYLVVACVGDVHMELWLVYVGYSENYRTIPISVIFGSKYLVSSSK